jgi:hypothetical protein
LRGSHEAGTGDHGKRRDQMKTLKRYTIEEKKKAGEWAQYHKEDKAWRRHYIQNDTEYRGEIVAYRKKDLIGR